MSNSPHAVRNYCPADFNNYVLLNIEAERLEPAGRRVSPQVIAEQLGRPGYSPQRDLFLVETAGRIVGYMDVVPELAIGRVILDCWVHPEHRRAGLARRLLGCAIRRANETPAEVAQVSILEDNVVGKTVLSRLGFGCVRRFLELRLDMGEVPRQDIDRAALECCHLRYGEEDKLTAIQNRCFAGTWGYNPNTVETIAYRLSSGSCSPEDVLLCCHRDKVIGYCWTEIAYEGEAGIGARKGRVFMLGVEPDYRDKGVGKRVLLAGLAHLKGKGLGVAELTVDGENEAACALYRSVGFKVRTSSLWYERAIGQGTRAG